MTKTYSAELKNSIIAKMLPPHNCRVPELSEDTGIPKDTLYGWRTKNRNGRPTAQESTPANFTGTQKFQFLLESAALNEHELSEFCRRQGCFPEQLKAWREACELANDLRPRRAEQAERRELREENKRLKKELLRKEKALAEMAALMVLKKKVQTIWGEAEDEKLNSKNEAKLLT